MMRIGICDDQQEVRELIAEKIKRLYPDAAVTCYETGDELLSGRQLPEILFLDIQMPGTDGMETARVLRGKDKGLIIIFVTAIEDYVFQAFDVRAFHYLVKPFTDGKLAEILRGAEELLAERENQAPADAHRELPSLMITAGGRHIAVNIEEIVYAEVFDRKVVIHTLDADIEYYGKMKELENKVGADFFRPHRAYLVNFNYIKKYDAKTIDLTRGQALMAKQNYQEFVKSYLRFNQRKGRE